MSRWTFEFVVAVAVVVPALLAVGLVLILMLLLADLLVLLGGLLVLGSRSVLPLSVLLTFVGPLGGECLWLI
jgi:hypothetical protein